MGAHTSTWGRGTSTPASPASLPSNCPKPHTTHHSLYHAPKLNIDGYDHKQPIERIATLFGPWKLPKVALRPCPLAPSAPLKGAGTAPLKGAGQKAQRKGARAQGAGPALIIYFSIKFIEVYYVKMSAASYVGPRKIAEKNGSLGSLGPVTRSRKCTRARKCHPCADPPGLGPLGGGPG
jgi:hypothetical protein